MPNKRIIANTATPHPLDLKTYIPLLTCIHLSAGSAIASVPADGDVFADTWVATDALGRSLPTFDEVGPPRANRQVGLFYFLWLNNGVSNKRNIHVYDNTKILAENPTDPKWGPGNSFYFWVLRSSSSPAGTSGSPSAKPGENPTSQNRWDSPTGVDTVAFHVACAEDISSSTDPNWMRLFIDVDMNFNTGWNGYDLLINRTAPTSAGLSAHTIRNGRSSELPRIPYKVNGKNLELALPRTWFGSDPHLKFDFKWADNQQKDGDVIEFAIHGDSAPDRRFNYRYDQTVTEARIRDAKTAR